jgi:hypothetical protein
MLELTKMDFAMTSRKFTRRDFISTTALALPLVATGCQHATNTSKPDPCS